LIPCFKVGLKCKIILSGDPFQLSPTVHCKVASGMGLSLSLQERLMKLPLYESGLYCVMTRLTNNYRSHKALLDVPSELFYEGQLRACALNRESDASIKFNKGNDRFPMLFHDVHNGKQWASLLHNDTPSFQNQAEASEIVKICLRLCGDDSLDVEPKDVAVITPFRAQVLLIRQTLRDVKDGKYNYGLVNVGQVEDLQGQESRIVIVSSVLTASQGGKKVGFMQDPFKFNVAVTRAKSLLIVCGKMSFLEGSGESFWSVLIDHCRGNGSITHSAGYVGNDAEEKNNKKVDEASFLSAELDKLEGDFGINLLIANSKRLCLGLKSEEDKYNLALRGYTDSPEWRITI